MRIFTIISISLIFLLSAFTAKSQVSFNITQTTADAGTEVSIEFVVSNFNDMIGFTIPIRWNRNVISINRVSSVASLPDFTPTTLNFGLEEGMNTGSMIANWESPGFTPRMLPNQTVLFTLVFNVVGNPGQMSMIEIFDDINNNSAFVNSNFQDVGFTQSAGRVTVTGMGGGLFVFGSNEVGATGSTTCVKIRANSFTNVGGFQFAVTWNPAFMTLQTITSGTLPNFGGGDFSIDNAAGVALITYNTQNGVTLPNGSTILDLCFRITATSGSSPVNISGIPEEFFDIVFATPAGMPIPFTTGNGSVSVDGVPECIPEGFTFVFDRLNVEPGQTFCYPIKVANFTNILSTQFCLQWDPSVLRFIEPTAFFLPGMTASNFNLINSGTLASLWFSSSTDPISVDDFNAIFSLCFEAIGEVGACTEITLSGSCLDGGIVIEFEDGSTISEPFICSGDICVREDLDITIALDQINNVNCPDGINGGIAVDVTGGRPPYSYSWQRVGTPGIISTNQNLTNVGPGQYNLTVTDSQGNSSVAGPFTVEAQFNISVTQETMNPLCAGDSNGSIALNISGNTGTITNIVWNPGPSGPNETTLPNASAGTYNVRISYGQGCAFETNITLADGQSPIVNANVNNDNGTINLNVSGGAAPYEYLWSDNNMSQNRTGLAPGTYSVTVTDANGCETVAGPFTIESTDPGMLTVTTTLSNFNGFGVSCNGTCDGTINLNISGGTAPYNVTWTGGATGSSRVNLCAGTYSYTVTDANSLTSTGSVTLSAPPILRVEIVDFMQSTMDNGMAIVAATGGVAPYSYVWNDPLGTTGPQIVNQPADIRVVTVTDINGCERTLPVNFAQAISDDCYENRLVITPNGDGLNDELIITCISGVENQLDIFDRYGKLVFSARNYDNTWMGTHSNGTALPDGGYFFVLRVVEQSGVERTIRNSFNIIRDLK